MPAGLLESELFGHVRGAFTGAIASHSGRVTLAHGATSFRDGRGDMHLEHQPKLLRLLQEREFETVGSTRTKRVDVRFIAATNGDLWQMVQDHKFREDLYYRLKCFPVILPPLRERKEDIPEFVKCFVEHFASSMGKIIETIPEETMRAIISHSWPGNVRELQSYVERGVILSKDGVFRPRPPEERQGPLLERSNPTLEDKVREEIPAACQRATCRLARPRAPAPPPASNCTP